MARPMSIDDVLKEVFPSKSDKHKEWAAKLREQDVENVDDLIALTEKDFDSLPVTAVVKSGLRRFRDARVPVSSSTASNSASIVSVSSSSSHPSFMAASQLSSATSAASKSPSSVASQITIIPSTSSVNSSDSSGSISNATSGSSTATDTLLATLLPPSQSLQNSMQSLRPFIENMMKLVQDDESKRGKGGNLSKNSFIKDAEIEIKQNEESTPNEPESSEEEGLVISRDAAVKIARGALKDRGPFRNRVDIHLSLDPVFFCYRYNCTFTPVSNIDSKQTVVKIDARTGAVQDIS